jgi:hypothetical protein
MLPNHIKDYVVDTLAPEDIIYELDLDSRTLIEALDRYKVDLKIFEARYIADTEMELEYDEDIS